MIRRITLILLSFFSTINAQIALPTFQAVHKPHSSSSSSGTLTFTNCSATGRTGPTQSQVNSTYTSGNSLYNAVTINTQGIQEWTVPSTTTYTIEVFGAQGGTSDGGLGARMKGDFNLTSGDIIKVVVGQQGDWYSGWNSSGGGAGNVASYGEAALGIDAVSGEDGTDGYGGGDGGTDGNGGSGTAPSGAGGGGAGWLSDGGASSYSSSCEGGSTKYLFYGGNGYQNHDSDGGFGGGGGGLCGAGGGGGYSGGGSGQGSSWCSAGGGGGSYNSGANQDNSSGVKEGHGQVIITY